MRHISPCKDCDDRTSSCHSFCSKYNEFVTKHEEEKRIIKENKEKYMVWMIYKKCATDKMKKRINYWR